MFNWLDLTCVHRERAFVQKACRRFALVALPAMALACAVTLL